MYTLYTLYSLKTLHCPHCTHWKYCTVHTVHTKNTALYTLYILHIQFTDRNMLMKTVSREFFLVILVNKSMLFKSTLSWHDMSLLSWVRQNFDNAFANISPLPLLSAEKEGACTTYHPCLGPALPCTPSATANIFQHKYWTFQSVSSKDWLMITCTVEGQTKQQ